MVTDDYCTFHSHFLYKNVWAGNPMIIFVLLFYVCQMAQKNLHRVTLKTSFRNYHLSRRNDSPTVRTLAICFCLEFTSGHSFSCWYIFSGDHKFCTKQQLWRYHVQINIIIVGVITNIWSLGQPLMLLFFISLNAVRTYWTYSGVAA